jgi:hypothetical protein
MKKCYLLIKRSWGDFDIQILEPISVFLDEGIAVYEVKKRNSKLTKEEIREEISYAYDKLPLITQ